MQQIVNMAGLFLISLIILKSNEFDEIHYIIPNTLKNDRIKRGGAFTCEDVLNNFTILGERKKTKTNIIRSLYYYKS